MKFERKFALTLSNQEIQPCRERYDESLVMKLSSWRTNRVFDYHSQVTGIPTGENLVCWQDLDDKAAMDDAAKEECMEFAQEHGLIPPISLRFQN
jgi:hypothetical protein